MTKTDVRALELNVVSAYDLKKVMTFGKQSCFVVAYVEPSQKKSTKVDRTGGRNPSWNSKLTLTCDERLFSKTGSYITVEIYSNGRITNKLVGTVTVPLLDVLRSRSISSKPQVMGYQVRRRSGRIQGTLNLSVKLGEKKTISTLPEPRCYGRPREDCREGYQSPHRYGPAQQYRFGSQSPYRYGTSQQFYGHGGMPQFSHHVGQQQWPSAPQY